MKYCFAMWNSRFARVKSLRRWVDLISHFALAKYFTKGESLWFHRAIARFHLYLRLCRFYAIINLKRWWDVLSNNWNKFCKIIFDKEKTKEYRTDFNKPCDCQDCRNYYKNIQNNFELVEFLSGFGIDYNCTEEVFSWDLGNDNDALIHHEGY